MKHVALLCAALLLAGLAGCGKTEEPAKPDPALAKAEQEQLFRCRACGKTVKNSAIERTSQTAGKCPECKRIAPMIPVK